MSLVTTFVAAFLAIASTSAADPSPHAKAACKLLQGRFPNQYADSGVDWPNGATYTEQLHAYWSQANADNIPACMFFPETADDIAFVVRMLNNYTDVPFAVKGGGHNANVGYSSSKGGILIATEPNMATTRLDGNNLAHVGPGSRWIDVATALEPYDRVVVSGRLGDVGVAGLTLGGGLSFLSTEHGMAADTVVEYEIVTAAGEMARANKDENSDIFYALKGGGNQFAIVTSFVLQTFPSGPVWGGTKIYGLDQKDALIRATHNLVSNYHDPKAAVIVTFSTTLHDLVDVFVVFYFYNDPRGPGEILAEFNAIPALVDQTKGPRSYRDLIGANSEFSLKGMRYLIRTNTLPNLAGEQGLDLYHYTFDSWYEPARRVQAHDLENYAFSLAWQPVPHQLQNASTSAPHGVNLLGLDARHGDKVFMEYDVSWLSPWRDHEAAAAMHAVTQPVAEYAQRKFAGVPPTHHQEGDVSYTNFNPMFMNDCMYDQDPLRSYGEETYRRLGEIQRRRDAKGLFAKRTGGFKLA